MKRYPALLSIGEVSKQIDDFLQPSHFQKSKGLMMLRCYHHPEGTSNYFQYLLGVKRRMP